MNTGFVVLCVALVRAFAQQPAGPDSFGGGYERLAPEQKRLVQDWNVEYAKITGRRMDAAASYNNLPLSARTTFDAVTHALLRTKITARDGSPMGTALDLVQLVEAVHGQIPGVRGDHQFRLYVLLKRDALSRLYKCREFKRIGDNSIFHIGYPVNFRQQGGAPSMQNSVTRTGRRADIDVDYRSSSGPKALFNGHLTAANSDVRAGNNYERHSRRWTGYENWWKDLIGLFRPPPARDVAVALDVNVSDKPRTRSSEPVNKAVHDFYQSWLVDGNPEAALSYISVKSYACLAEFQGGEGIESGLAARRILEHMRQGLAAYGKSASLGEVIEAFPLRVAGGKPVSHDQAAFFHLEMVPGGVARVMDCRVRLHINLAEPLPDFSNQPGDTFVSALRLKKEQGQVLFSQVWTKEEGFWKVVSWHLEHPLQPPDTYKASLRESAAPAQSQVKPDESLVRAAERLYTAWLIERKYDQAAASFAADVSACEPIRETGSARALLEDISAQLPRAQNLGSLITTVEHGHSHMQEVSHPLEKSFLLARVSDDLAAMSTCTAATPSQKATDGKPTFRKNVYQTIARFKGAPGEAAAALQFQWARQGNEWKIVALSIAH